MEYFVGGVLKGDAELFDAWCAGDREAGTMLFRRHFDDVYGFFKYKVGSDADELTQRVFEVCVIRRDRFRRDGSFRAFLFGIARYQFLRHLRSISRKAVDPWTDCLAATGCTPGRLVAERRRRAALLEAMSRIPIEFQVTLEFVYWKGLSVHEVATALDIAPGTVKSRLHRARALLKRELRQLRSDATGQGYPLLHTYESSQGGDARSGS